MNAPDMQSIMQVMQLLQGAQATSLLTAGIELDVFGAMKTGPQTIAGIAERISAPPRSTGILVDALAVLGLLQKEGSGTSARFSLTPGSAQLLVRDQPTYMGGLTKIFANPMFFQNMPRMAETVRNDGTVLDKHAETPGHTFWEGFAEGSSALAFPSAAALDGLIGSWLAGRPKTRVLDIAAGSGIYGFSLLKHPGVELTSLDWPNVLEKTREWAKRLGVDGKRVRYLEGNLFEVEYGGPYDLVLLSHVYHHFDDATCARLTKKVAAVVAPGGRVAIQDMLTDGENPGARMFSALMLFWTKKGQAYTGPDYTRWLEGAGLSKPSIHGEAGMPASWLVSEKR